MSRIPEDIIWMTIGDVYGDLFQGDSKRFIEALWQCNYNVAADTLEYINHQKRLKTIISAESTAPYGNMPVILSENEDNKVLKGRVQWGYERGGKWVWVVFTESDQNLIVDGRGNGTITVGDTPFIYTSYNTEVLATGGRLYYFSCNEIEFGRERLFSFSGYLLGSEFFNSETQIGERFVNFLPNECEATPLGIKFDVPGMDWSGLYDNASFTGAANWKIVAKARISKKIFDENGRRIISFDSFGSEEFNEQRIQICVDIDSGQAAIKLNIHQGETQEFDLVSRSISNEDLYSLLISGNVELEFKISYIAEGSRIIGEVSINEHVFRYENADNIPVDPGKRQHNFTVFNSGEDLEVFLEGIIVQDGFTWDSGAISDTVNICTTGRYSAPCDSITIASYGFPFSYTCYQSSGSDVESLEQEEGGLRDVVSVVDALGGACSYPFALTPTGKVIDHDVDNGTIDIEIDDGWNSSFPDNIRTNIDSDLYILWGDLSYESDDPSVKRYIIKTTTNSSGSSVKDMDVNLRPWYLERSEIYFVHAGKIKTRFKAPGEKIWLLEARGEEVDIYRRYGLLLGLDDETDSEEYLDTVKGMYIGKSSHPSKLNLQRSIDILLGLPFSPRPGDIGDLYEVKNIFNEIISYAVEVGEYIEPVRPYWRSKIKTKGVSVDAFENITTVGSKVDDWITNGELTREYAGVWEQWCTFIVSIPIEIGMSFKSAKYTLELLKAAKDVHRKFIILQRIIEGDETLTELVDEPIEVSAPMANAHCIADMVFDDDGTVTNNVVPPEQPTYPLNGHPLFLSWETQMSPELLMEEGMLGEGRGLDGSILIRPDVTFDDPGEIYGLTYGLQDTDLFNRQFYRSDSARDIGRLNPIDILEEVFEIGDTTAPGDITLQKLPIGGTVSITYWSSQNLSPGIETMTDDGVGSISGSGANSATIDFSTGIISSINLDNAPENPSGDELVLKVRYSSYVSPFSKRRLRMLESNRLPAQFVIDVYGQEPQFEGLTGMWNYISRPYTRAWFYSAYGESSEPIHSDIENRLFSDPNIKISQNEGGFTGSFPVDSSWSIPGPGQSPAISAAPNEVLDIAVDSTVSSIYVIEKSGMNVHALDMSTLIWANIGASGLSSSAKSGITEKSGRLWACSDDKVSYIDTSTLVWEPAIVPIVATPNVLRCCGSDNQSASTSVWFAGENGYIIEKTDDSTAISSDWLDHTGSAGFTPTQNINDIWVVPDPNNIVWAVGDQDQIKKYDGAQWIDFSIGAFTGGSAQNLHGVHGYYDYLEQNWVVWVVGDSHSGQTKMWRLSDNGVNSAFTEYTPNVAGLESVNLKAINFHTFDDNGTFLPSKYYGHAVGDDGSVMQWNGSMWFKNYIEDSGGYYQGDLVSIKVVYDSGINKGLGFAGGVSDGVSSGILTWF